MSHAGKQQAMSCSRDTTTKASTQRCCSNLFKLLRKRLKMRGVRLLGKSCQQKCKYDPLSYSLNFDANGCGNLADDEDYYYRFYAFSSRFVAASRSTSCPKLIGATSQ